VPVGQHHCNSIADVHTCLLVWPIELIFLKTLTCYKVAVMTFAQVMGWIWVMAILAIVFGWIVTRYDFRTIMISPVVKQAIQDMQPVLWWGAVAATIMFGIVMILKFANCGGGSQGGSSGRSGRRRNMFETFASNDDANVAKAINIMLANSEKSTSNDYARVAAAIDNTLKTANPNIVNSWVRWAITEVSKLLDQILTLVDPTCSIVKTTEDAYVKAQSALTEEDSKHRWLIKNAYSLNVKQGRVHNS
jgi:hypothetical protein